jgi:hypothetical protein
MARFFACKEKISAHMPYLLLKLQVQDSYPSYLSPVYGFYALRSGPHLTSNQADTTRKLSTQWRGWTTPADLRPILQTSHRPTHTRSLPRRESQHPCSASLPPRRHWFIDDVRAIDGRSHYRVCIRLWEDEIYQLKHLRVTTTEIRRTGACVRHRVQLWLPEKQLPESKTECFQLREERMRSLRSFRGQG